MVGHRQASKIDPRRFPFDPSGVNRGRTPLAVVQRRGKPLRKAARNLPVWRAQIASLPKRPCETAAMVNCPHLVIAREKHVSRVPVDVGRKSIKAI